MSEPPHCPIRVSTIIPVYNGAATIAAAIDSALAQDFAGQEIIVVNDGSTDNTAEVLAAYGERIRVIHQPNRGLSKAHNAGIAIALGKYIAFLDADDYWLAGRVSEMVRVLDSDPSVGLVFSDYLIKDPDTGEMMEPATFDGPPTLEQMLTQWNTAAVPTATTIRRSILDQVGGFDERINWGDDIYLWLRAREVSKFAHIATPLAVYHKTREPKRRYTSNQRRTFERVLIERYGRSARPLVSLLRDVCASFLTRLMLNQIDQREPLQAAKTLVEVLQLRPSYLLRHARVSRRNLRRVLAFTNIIRTPLASAPSDRPSE
ncbi:MAG TPA: glycosyltransferase [Candidatus Binataceae bacterium]|nr:glycosyltransferase [Candidatus Binataceae bacterium]